MTSTTQAAWRTRNRPIGSPRFAPFFRFVSRVPLAYKVYRERQALLSLSDRGLEDIGLSRAEVQREASRALWDIPEYR